jgi:hypothetical protein
MRTDEIPPELSNSEQQLLSRFVAEYEPPADAANRVLARVASSAAMGPVPLGTGAIAFGAKSIAAIASAALVAGAMGGFWVGRQQPASLPPPINLVLTSPPPVAEKAPSEAVAPQPVAVLRASPATSRLDLDEGSRPNRFRQSLGASAE